MPFVLESKGLGKKDVKLIGGKGANLAELINAGFPVPEAFFITAKAYEVFAEENDLKEKIFGILEKVSYEDVNSLTKASEEIKKLIVEAKMPEKIRDEVIDAYKKLYGAPALNLDFVKPMDMPFVAVRSSGIMEDIEKASSAGQYETFLNVKGEENLINAVKKCWASLYTARVIYYRHKNNQPQDTSIGVIVQRMVNSEGSGVVFTVDPTNPKEGANHIVIEACWGLGETLVQGKVEPDRYIVDKINGEILEKIIGNKKTEMIRDPMYGITVEKKVIQDKTDAQVLSDYEIVALAAYCKKIEQYYNFPQDIEWAIERGKIYIVQTRAVTTLEEKKTEPVKGIPILEGYGVSPGVASGVVKIIRDANEIWKIEKGDVLVTKMTNPDFVVAMEKSSAIVTDEGGATCIGRGAKILTEEGFKNIEDVYNEVKINKKKIKTLSLNTKTLRVEWRNIVDAQKRVSDVFVNNIFLHPTNKEDNVISITPDHKMLTIDGMNIIKRQLDDLQKNNENLIIANKIPLLEDRYSSISPQLMYLSGAIFSDGSLVYRDFKPIGTRFSQKPEESKKQFISAVVKAFENEFNAPFRSYCINKFSRTLEFSSNKKLPAVMLNDIKEKLTDLMLFSNEEEITNFLAGFSDGDGHLNKEKGWLELYIDSKQENITQALVIACLRLSVPFRIDYKKRNCTALILYNCEQLDIILSKCLRIKTKRFSRTEDYKLFSAKQLIGDVRKDIDWRGSLWAYVKRNSMIGIDKLVNYVRNERIKEKLRRFAESDIRMMRFKVIGIKKQEDVFNLTIDADDETNHNYIVFTNKYTPIILGNCHAAIVSRELGVPCVVATKTATQTLKDGMKITVDATHGKVYSGEVEIKEEKAKETEIKTKVQIKVNLAFPETAEKAKNADGVGLLRLEHMLTKAGMHPIEYVRQGRGEELTKIIFDGVGKIAQAFYPKPVWVRSLDARTDEFRGMKGGDKEPKEDNPMLGWHGIRRSLDEPEILRCELKALKQLHEKGLMNVVWELPFIINVSELRKAKEIAEEIGASKDFGIMVEVPAAALAIEDFCKEGIAFASLGSNDLTQTTLGIDRNNEKLINIFDEMHPAMQFLFKYVIDACKKYGVESSICGELPSNRRDAIEFLVKAGIDSLSVNLDAIEKVREWASETEKS